jgi:threonine aldolase
MQHHIDFRSDTVTQPTAAMRAAMMEAKVGDDVYGEDVTVNLLERKLADRFAMEAGLFCPSGTMSNQIAIKCHTQPLDELICDQTAHVYRYEGGGIAFNSQVSVRLLHGDRGIITPEMILPEINEENIHFPRTRLVVLENTVNKGGGNCYTLAQIAKISKLCRQKGLTLHLDGARIFNALVATQEKAKDYGKYFDSISVCLSKGLGAPVGSVLLGSSALIERAKRIRKVLGGGMRQAGFLAAAGIYALDYHVERLVEDHRHAKQLADTLMNCSFVSSVIKPETNIVLFDVAEHLNANQVVERLSYSHILCNATSSKTIRLVTHLDISEADINQAIERLKQIHF